MIVQGYWGYLGLHWAGSDVKSPREPHYVIPSESTGNRLLQELTVSVNVLFRLFETEITGLKAAS